VRALNPNKLVPLTLHSINTQKNNYNTNPPKTYIVDDGIYNA